MTRRRGVGAMKEKVIEIAGKAWRFLGQNGQTNVSQLAKSLKEKDEVVFQALGWLAREEKSTIPLKTAAPLFLWWKGNCAPLIRSSTI